MGIVVVSQDVEFLVFFVVDGSLLCVVVGCFQFGVVWIVFDYWVWYYDVEVVCVWGIICFFDFVIG